MARAALPVGRVHCSWSPGGDRCRRRAGVKHERFGAERPSLSDLQASDGGLDQAIRERAEKMRGPAVPKHQLLSIVPHLFRAVFHKIAGEALPRIADAPQIRLNNRLFVTRLPPIGINSTVRLPLHSPFEIVAEELFQVIPENRLQVGGVGHVIFCSPKGIVEGLVQKRRSVFRLSIATRFETGTYLTASGERKPSSVAVDAFRRVMWDPPVGPLWDPCGTFLGTLRLRRVGRGHKARISAGFRVAVAGGPGFEPRMPGSEPGVLPLNYPPEERGRAQ